MAIVPTELFSSASKLPYPRITPHPDGVVPKRFEAGTALLAVGTAVSYDTVAGLWQLVDLPAGTNDSLTIRGFVYPDPIQLVAGGETIGNVMIKGVIHRDDVPLNGETQAAVDDALDGTTGTLNLQDAGLIVQGLLDLH